jgi:glucose/arabinose dehydrogenase
MKFKLFALISLSCFVACNSVNQQKTETKKEPTISNAVKLQLVTNVINAPIEIDEPIDNSKRLFITDLNGKIWIVKNDSVKSKPFLDITTKLEQKDTTAEIKGLFSMAFHPQYSINRKFYVCYNAPTKIKENVCKLVVSEFTAQKDNSDIADINSERRVFELEGKGVEMFASQIAFGPDGYLYISIGDHGDSNYKNRGQDLSCFNGKLLRIDVNKTPYAIPVDNPFTGIKNERPEIFAYGFRRLWRFSFDPVTSLLIGGDVGDVKQEEIDIIRKGENYGWPVKEGDSIYSKSNDVKISFTSPISTYSHKEGIAVIGGSFYHGNDLPFLKNKYVFADFNGNLFTLTKTTEGSWTRESLRILNKPSDPFLICSFNTDEDNNLYVTGLLNTNSGFKGVVYKIMKV